MRPSSTKGFEPREPGIALPTTVFARLSSFGKAANHRQARLPRGNASNADATVPPTAARGKPCNPIGPEIANQVPGIFGEPDWDRTNGQLIKSQLLYR